MEAIKQIQKQIEEAKSETERRQLIVALGEAFASVRRGCR